MNDSEYIDNSGWWGVLLYREGRPWILDFQLMGATFEDVESEMRRRGYGRFYDVRGNKDRFSVTLVGE